MEFSDCCGCSRWNDTDLCGACLEHAEFEDDEDE